MTISKNISQLALNLPIIVANPQKGEYTMKKTGLRIGVRTVAALCAGTAVSAAYGGIVFEESFRNYSDTAPGVVADNGMTVGNDPIWANAAELNVRARVASMVFVEDIALPEDNQFDILLKYCFLNSTVPGTQGSGVPSYFDIVLKTTQGGEQRIRLPVRQPLFWRTRSGKKSSLRRMEASPRYM